MSTPNYDSLAAQEANTAYEKNTNANANVSVSKRRQKKRWIWLGIAAAILAIVVVVIAVPVALVKQRENESSPPESTPESTPEYSHAVSPFANLIRTKTYNDMPGKKRIFVIGDVHGCRDELDKLVQALHYNADTDQLILAGDLVNRGPDSPGVLKLAKQLGALCVRGNHDDKVVRCKTFENERGVNAMEPGDALLPEGKVGDPLTFDSDQCGVARNLTQEEYEYLASCPLVLDLPFVNAYVVHGGLDPNISDPINDDPWSVLNMRNIDSNVPTASNSDGKHWTKFWNAKQFNQTSSGRPVKTVFYGHDASRGLDLENTTFGTDSGCVYGGKLSAYEIFTHNLTQVKCPTYSS